MNTSEIVTGHQERLLEALERYRFLTAKQLVASGVHTSEANAREMTRLLVGRKLIGCLKPPLVAGVGKLPYQYHLASKGAEYLAEALDYSDPRYPKKKLQSLRTIPHRMGIVDFQISVDAWYVARNQSTPEWIRDFDKNPKIKTQPTTVFLEDERLTPDAVFWTNDQNGQKHRLFSLEIERTPDPRPRLRKINLYLPFLRGRAIENHFQYMRPVRVLLVLDDDEALRRFFNLAKDRLNLAPEYERAFWISTQRRIKDFQNGWLDLQGNPRGLF